MPYLPPIMKKLLFIPFFIFQFFTAIAQPVVYFDFVTHNEESPVWNGVSYYTNNRARLVALGNYFQANGITWNMQSDWRYLTNVLSQETPALMATTNNKNILLWLQDDMGVEMDPHAHESQYIYPDVAHLMDSIGLIESKLIGGSIYNDSNGINIWTNLVNGQYGNIFPNAFWQPDYMMGGGTPDHVADLNYYGMWNPQSPTNYLVHDTTSHLRHIGTGCSIKIKDTSAVANVVAEINDVVQKVQSGQYPSNGFYLQTIFFEQGDLNNLMFYNKVLQVADSANAIVASGTAQWKTLKQAYTQWETAYNAQMFQWECGQLVAGVMENEKEPLNIYPNPFHDMLHFDFGPESLPATVQIVDVTGRIIYSFVPQQKKYDISTGMFFSGIYFLKVIYLPGAESVFKIVKE